MPRISGRAVNESRPVKLTKGVSRHAEGSCLVECGHTKVLCTASIDSSVPSFLRNTGKGWVTAEYGMLPRSTHSRNNREAAKGKQTGRTQEIQRLIGRSLRSVVQLDKMGERQITVDCDVLEADGGTRTAAITGGFVALYQALATLHLPKLPITTFVAATSCGIVKGEAVLDLDYAEDSNAQADANFILSEQGHIIEIQATAEKDPFSESQFAELMSLAKKGIAELIIAQKEVLA